MWHFPSYFCFLQKNQLQTFCLSSTITHSYLQSTLDCFLDHPEQYSLSCHDNKNRMLGFITYSLVKSSEVSPALVNLAVERWARIDLINIPIRFRSQKVGSHLLAVALYCAFKLQCTDCYLNVRKTNEAAIKLYISFGFKIVKCSRCTLPCQCPFDLYHANIKTSLCEKIKWEQICHDIPRFSSNPTSVGSEAQNFAFEIQTMLAEHRPIFGGYYYFVVVIFAMLVFIMVFLKSYMSDSRILT